MVTLVEQVGVVGLEEEDKEAVVAVDGALEGFEFEASDDLIAGVVPGLGEIGVAAAPAVDGGSGDASPAGGLYYGCAELAGGVGTWFYWPQWDWYRRRRACLRLGARSPLS